jgi:hypothetical protein
MGLREHNPRNMNKQKITRFLQSMVTIPLFAIMPITGIATQVANPSVEISKIVSSVTESKVIITPEDQLRIERAAKIDAILEKYNSPLAGYGMKFVTEAEKNNIEWNLVVAISGIESTFARHACKKATNSFLGYGSCKIDFKSADDAIEKVSESLGGNNPNTAHHYDGKTTAQILRKYNSVIPDYSQRVYRIMKMIDETKVELS